MWTACRVLAHQPDECLPRQILVLEIRNELAGIVGEAGTDRVFVPLGPDRQIHIAGSHVSTFTFQTPVQIEWRSRSAIRRERE